MSVSFSDANTGTVVGGGGTILRTINGGTLWTAQTSVTSSFLNSVSFTDANNGTAVGASGTIVRTTNGGTTWFVQNSGTANALRCVCFTTANTGTSVGDEGTILRTTNAALPVELISFLASSRGNAVDLRWNTATEVNNYGFEIERKTSHSPAWTKIGFIAGNGTSSSPHRYAFSDNAVTGGKLVYRLKQVDNGGAFEYSGESEVISAPITTVLHQNYPNPFNPSTLIGYDVASATMVRLAVYDMLGREVALLVNGQHDQGSYTAEFDGSWLSSGVYVYKLDAGQFSDVKRLTVMR